MINNLGIGLVELSLNYGCYAHCGNSLDKAAPRQCQTVISFWCGHDGSPSINLFRLNRRLLVNQVLAESARVTTAAPNMMASLMISRPAPDRYGNPSVEAPNAGTHASGVVTKNESVVRDIRIRRKLPTAETCGRMGYAAIRTPIRTITTPNPWENEYVPFDRFHF